MKIQINSEKATQDLSWACLPKETRGKAKKYYKYAGEDSIEKEVLQDLFGHHNLTSDTEPSELIYADRQKTRDFIGALYENARKSGSESELQAYQMAINYLEELFGDKCLPDKEPPVQSEPKFKVGDIVRVKYIPIYEGEIGIIDEIGSRIIEYHLKGNKTLENDWFAESYLEHYTEPETKDTMEEKGHRNKALYDALCELESASVKVRKALIAL